MTGEEYARLVDVAVDAIEEKEFAKARAALAKAQRGISHRKTASVLEDLVGHWEQAAKDPNATMKWNEVEQLLVELTEEQPTGKCSAFADKHLRSVRHERRNEAKAEAVLQLISDGKYEDALKRYFEIPEESVFRKRLQSRVAPLKGELRLRSMQSAKAAEDKQQWDQAIRLYRQAEHFAEAGDPEISGAVARCTKFREHKNWLVEGQALAMMPAEASQAIQVLGRIPKDSPYYARAQAQIRETRAKQGLQRVQRLYDGGNGKGALQEIAKLGVGGELKGRIEAVMAAWEAGKAAEAAKAYTRAIEQWQKVESLEANPRNWYRRQAMTKIGEYGPKRLSDIPYQKALQELYKVGKVPAEDGQHYAAARDLFQKALSVYPNHAEARRQLERFKSRANTLYNEALNDSEKGNSITALRKLRMVLNLVLPTDKLHGRARTKIRQLQGQ
jgi:tetratricopeptide (TPR) repeat protein